MRIWSVLPIPPKWKLRCCTLHLQLLKRGTSYMWVFFIFVINIQHINSGLLATYPISLLFWVRHRTIENFPAGSSGKETACQCQRPNKHRFSPWVRKTPGERQGNPLQYSFLENPMDRGAWWATVYGVTKSRTRLKKLSTPHIVQEKTLYHAQAGEASLIFGP